MDISVVVISIVALVASCGSAWFAYVQARASRQQADLYEKERHELTSPRVRCRYYVDSGHEAITFINEGPSDINDGVLEIGTVGYQLVDRIAGQKALQHFAWPVGSGESYVFTRLRPDPGIATFLLKCTSPKGWQWNIAVTCDVPQQPQPI